MAALITMRLRINSIRSMSHEPQEQAVNVHESPLSETDLGAIGGHSTP